MVWCRYKVAFVMPSKYKSTGDLPKPNNKAVELKEIPGHVLAAISWRSGSGLNLQLD